MVISGMHNRLAQAIVVAVCTFSAGHAATPTAAVRDSNWQTGLSFRDRYASASFDGKTYRLDSNGSQHEIPIQNLRADTASPLFDALFALAQQELTEAHVTKIKDSAFNHGQAIDCDCFETGKKWTYVWTRDSAYSIDLALGALDPARSRRTLEFKLSAPRVDAGGKSLSDSRLPTPDSLPLYIVQDTGSGGSWPISTDRIVWFLAARHLLEDRAFGDKVYKALNDTLAQDKKYIFDTDLGLYRGETSFLDWREQTYPYWTEKDVRYIAESFALSTNVLHYQALQLARELSAKHGDTASAAQYGNQAAALKTAIDTLFWREDRGTYMSYIGNSAGRAQPVEAYDLLGTSLAILAGIPDAARARKALSNYPTYPAGSPVIWPERKALAIYHNRAIWPFVSAYALKAARQVDDVPRIAHELRSILQGPALAGSNMENYEFLSGAAHVEDGKFSGPVVNSTRQLWSVAATLDAVIEGVFGIGEATDPAPKIPAELIQMLFGLQQQISLSLPDASGAMRRIILQRPAKLAAGDNLLIADSIKRSGSETTVQLRGTKVATTPLQLDAPAFAPAEPTNSPLGATRADYGDNPLRLYQDSKLLATWSNKVPAPGKTELPPATYLQTLWNTHFGIASQLESLPGPIISIAPFETVNGNWPRNWTPARDGRVQARMLYTNSHGPINTGVTAAVKMLTLNCSGALVQSQPIVMPHSVGQQLSTASMFTVKKGQACSFALEEGFNMSFLAHYAAYTGEQGGASGPVNAAEYGDLQIAPAAALQ
jgi:hypothetical protein